MQLLDLDGMDSIMKTILRFIIDWTGSDRTGPKVKIIICNAMIGNIYLSQIINDDYFLLSFYYHPLINKVIK